MKSQGHILAALPLGGVLYWAAGSAAPALAGAALSVLVDLDHALDYLIFGRARPSLGRFFAEYNTHRFPRLMLVMHSWEFLMPGALLLWALLGPVWAAALVGSWLYHLVWDQFANDVGPLFYFFAYRARRGFRRADLACPQPGGRRPA